MSRFVVWLAVGWAGCAQTSPETTPTLPPDLTALPAGTYYAGLGISAIGGLVVPMQLELTPAATEDGDTVFSEFALRAVGEGDALSDVLATTTDVPVTADAGFTAELPAVTLPGAFSPTGSDVAFELTLVADAVSPSGFCGDAKGEIVTFGIDLRGSTFGAVPWEDRALAPSSCDPPATQEIPRIVDCPELTAGDNTGFPSGGRSRSFELVLPNDYDPVQAYPLVLAYHGFGGNGADLLDDSGLRGYADALDIVLVVPDADDLGGTPGWDTFSNPLTNVDLALFDDLVTCATESFHIDPDHVHVTGMSNGGLMTGYLLATRGDVIASAAPMSGGIGADVLPSDHAVPSLVVWGGESDEAFEQDFNSLSLEMISTLLDNDQFVVACDHGLGHTLDPSVWPWVLQFLLDHPYDVPVEPYAKGLPKIFPEYCGVP